MPITRMSLLSDYIEHVKYTPLLRMSTEYAFNSHMCLIESDRSYF
jgi:hypothetical protein